MPTADPGNAQPEAWLGPPVSAATLDDLDDLARTLAAYRADDIGSGDVADLVRWMNGRRYPAGDSLPVLPRGAAETCAPAISAEMNDWIALGGASSGCVGDKNHGTGYHRGANYVPATDYSRRRDPNGADGPFTNWDYACAGDFRHGGNAALRARHKAVLALLRQGAFPMICEMIVQPDAGKPVMYWARWEGVANLREYTGSGHDLWSHISWYRSRANERPNLWKDTDMPDGLELDKAPINYPTKSAENPTWSGWNALGGARDAAAEAKDVAKRVEALVKTLGTQVTSLSTALTTVRTELATTRTEVGKLSTAVTAGQVAETDRDRATVAAVLQAIRELGDGDGPPVEVSEDALAAAIVRALRDVATPGDQTP